MQEEKRSSDLAVIDCYDVPVKFDLASIYHLLPKNPDEKYYWERVDRNIGWIIKEEQEMLRGKVVGIAGCGGMGGLIAATLLRLGVGEIRIADCEVFDPSNINRQFAARRNTVGESKAMDTAHMLRDITDDSTILVYPQGIVEQTVEHFLEGCDIVCDEIEFWAAGSRILLHQQARQKGISCFNCNTVGFSTYLFLFRSTGLTMEQTLGFSLQEAMKLQQKVQNLTARPEEVKRLMQAVIKGLIPEVPTYVVNEQDHELVYERLFNEGKASIIATNPPMASGFLSDRVLLELLADSKLKRKIVTIPEPPGYLYFDAARMKSEIITERSMS